MVEATFASSTKLMFASQVGQTVRGSEFVTIGESVFESEELSDRLYRCFIAMMTDGWSGNSGNQPSLDQIGNALITPFYLPCAQRLVLKGQVDLLNDEVPESCSIIERDRKSTVSSVTVRKEDKFPRGYTAPCQGTRVSITMMYEDRAARSDRRVLSGGSVTGVISEYAVIKDTGEIVPAIRVGDIFQGKRSGVIALMLQAACCCINANEDKRHLWLVRTGEPFLGKTEIKIDLGCSEEHIKSLFYARSMPVSASGRKRPILHWVSAHLRRVKAGIEIDVKKHLRGIEEFEMDGLRFRIFNPTKVKPA